MTLSCSCDFEYDGAGWFWDNHRLIVMPVLPRRKPCRCCGELINPGEEVFEFHRARWPRGDIEERIHGDEIRLPHWYACETCSDLISAVEDLGFCWQWGESIKYQIAEYREAEAEAIRWDKKTGKPPGWSTAEDFL